MSSLASDNTVMGGASTDQGSETWIGPDVRAPRGEQIWGHCFGGPGGAPTAEGPVFSAFDIFMDERYPKPNEGPKSINTQFANAKPSAESETSATGATTKRVAGRRVTRIPLASERRKHFTRGGEGRGSRLSAESQQSSRASGAGKSKVGAQNSQCTAPTGQRSSVAHQPIDPHASTGTNSPSNWFLPGDWADKTNHEASNHAVMKPNAIQDFGSNGSESGATSTGGTNQGLSKPSAFGLASPLNHSDDSDDEWRLKLDVRGNKKGTSGMGSCYGKKPVTFSFGHGSMDL